MRRARARERVGRAPRGARVLRQLAEARREARPRRRRAATIPASPTASGLPGPSATTIASPVAPSPRAPRTRALRGATACTKTSAAASSACRVVAEAEHAHGRARLGAQGRLERPRAGDEQHERRAGRLRRAHRGERVLARPRARRGRARRRRRPRGRASPGPRPAGRVRRRGAMPFGTIARRPWNRCGSSARSSSHSLAEVHSVARPAAIAAVTPARTRGRPARAPGARGAGRVS